MCLGAKKTPSTSRRSAYLPSFQVFVGTLCIRQQLVKGVLTPQIMKSRLYDSVGDDGRHVFCIAVKASDP